MTDAIDNGYDAGHPWYYVLGGRVLYPREIAEDARASRYCGWRERIIRKLDALPEPRRSTELRALRAEVVGEYRRDVSIYRECANALRRDRQIASPVEPVCDDVHTSLGLKYAHLYNDFAHMRFLDELLNRQPDLFG